MKQITKMNDFNPLYGFGDIRNSVPHVKLSNNTFTVICNYNYDKQITEEQALASELPIFQYNYTQ